MICIIGQDWVECLQYCKNHNLDPNEQYVVFDEYPHQMGGFNFNGLVVLKGGIKKRELIKEAISRLRFPFMGEE